MIRVIDGTLYQWGIDREIEILNPEIKKVAFANNHHCGNDPIDVVDGKVILPNKFLQSSQNIDVYGLDQDGNEIYSHQLEVNGKMKPKDYGIAIEGGGSKERILFFENVEFTKDKYAYSIDELGLMELVDSLDVLEDEYYHKILKKYRMIFYIDAFGYGRTKAVLEYDLPTPSVSGTYMNAMCVIGESNVVPLKITYESGYKEIRIAGLDTADRSVIVTCYLEEL